MLDERRGVMSSPFFWALTHTHEANFLELRLYMTQTSFSDMGLNPNIERALVAMGFGTATSIQAEAIPPIRAGRDVAARSQTGTGKTLAFAIPAVELIDVGEKTPTVQVLVLCPTRELAQQTGAEIRKVARYIPAVRPVEVYGGAAIDRQCIRLRRANIVIGTPGRVMDHMRRKTLKLSHLKMIVLDESDELLNMGFREDIETIFRDIPAERQTILFSATMPPAILALTKDFQHSPQIIEIDKDHATLEDIKQKYIEVPHPAKMAVLTALMKFYKPKKAIVFCNTKKMVDEITEMLNSSGVSAESIHSDIKQSQRTAAMAGFKHGNTSILVATDIASRGIDVSNVDFVINYDIPQNAEHYVHRIGRTGRAGKSGCSITICGGHREAALIRRIAAGINSKMTRIQLPASNGACKPQNQELTEFLEITLEEDSTRSGELQKKHIPAGKPVHKYAANPADMGKPSRRPAGGRRQDGNHAQKYKKWMPAHMTREK
ncbi:MAG: DEAD/DEAH box helicase [Oscillospiraceae bacterium]|nr:DEAD/DEAH box helicase [Oscillospiraceae bacterium]